MSKNTERFATRIDAERVKLQQEFNMLATQIREFESRLKEDEKNLEQHRGAIEAFGRMWAWLGELTEADEQEKQIAALREDAREKKEEPCGT